MESYKDRQIDNRQIDRQIDRWIDRQLIDKQIDRQIDRQIDQIDRQSIERWIYRVDTWIEIDRVQKIKTDRQSYRKIYKFTDRQFDRQTVKVQSS